MYQKRNKGKFLTFFPCKLRVIWGLWEQVPRLNTPILFAAVYEFWVQSKAVSLHYAGF